MKKLIIIGAGGYAKSVIDSLDFTQYEMCGFIDELKGEGSHLGYPILANSLDRIENANDYVYFIAIGNNKSRYNWYMRLKQNSLRIISVIDKTAIVSSKAQLEEGCFVGKLAIINSCVQVGANCIINTKALIEHGASLGNHVNISTNSVLNGDVQVGDGSFIGSCSVVIGQLQVGKWSTVGAGAVVIRNVGDSITVAGVPAKIIKEGAMLG